MKKLLLFFITLSFLFSSYANSEEISPFGFTFGEVLDNEYVDLYKEINAHGTCYETFNPPIKNSHFTHYKVCITPISKTIIGVSASRKDTNKESCYPLYFDLIKILGNKYNIFVPPINVDVAEKIYLNREDLLITLECYGQALHDLRITYSSNSEKLNKLREKERLEFLEGRLRNVDSQGL